MNYIKIHDRIILNATNRVKPDCYCENHHILPRSMGGNDDKTNIVALTAREHFLIHWLLYKIHKNSSMALAFFSMSKPVGNGRTRYTSRSFKYAREAGAAAVSFMKSGEMHHMYGLKGRDNPNFGSRRGDKTKMALSEKAKLRVGGLNPRAKKIVCIDTGEVFDSISEAKKAYPGGNINYSIKTGGKSKGLTFAYAKEDGTPHDFKDPLVGYASGERSWNSNPVINKTTGEVFETLKQAAESIGVSTPAIRYAIKNKSFCKNNRFENYET